MKILTYKKGDIMNFEKLKNCMNELVQEYNTPGVDCMVYKDHEVIFRYFTGMSDIENNKKMNGNELYFIYSMTKMLTCTAALQLYEKKKYSMSDPLSEYFPEFKKMKIASDEISMGDAAKITTGDSFGEIVKAERTRYAEKQITIKDLFTMGAGFDYAINDDAITGAINAGKTSTADIVRAMSEKTLGFEPGTRFRYSLCHDVLGALVEVWSGDKLGEYMRKNIFEPLEMKDTFFGAVKDEDRAARLAARYGFDENGKPERLSPKCGYNLTDEYESGGAGLTSCTEDYASFLDAIACGGEGRGGKRILSPETVELMGKNHLNEKQREDFSRLRPGYGYGLGVRTHMDRNISGSKSPIGEFGWDGAAGGFAMVDTKRKVSLTYFQHVHKWKIGIQNKIRNALYECIG